MSKYHVCPRCEGEGTHTNPAIDGNGITGSEMAEILHEDPDFLDTYMAGGYNIVCSMCNGRRVVTVDTVETYREMAEDRYIGAMEDGDWESANYWRNQR
jgi:hypothetical protein